MNLTDEIETLVKIAKEVLEENPTDFGSTLQVTDRTDQVSELLSEASKKALSIKSMYQTQVSCAGEGFQCIYLSAIVKTSEMDLGLRAIVADLNTLSERGLIHSTLAPVSSIDLARQPLQDDTSAVFAFVLVPVDLLDEANKITKYNTLEGAIGKQIGSLEMDLPEGDFLASIRISPYRAITENNLENILKDTIQEYRNVLPNGTEVVSVTKCAIVDLSISYVIMFRNPLMKDFKEVRLHHERHAVRIGDRIEQFSLLSSVEYIKR